ncbi:MAG: hypothetical protein IT317_02835 [Anaerolineales bacterium]|nr:hypothetical protein [Anaerolineales bacterium]
MPLEPNPPDTCSPWYECYTQAEFVTPAAPGRLAIEFVAPPAAEPALAAAADGAADALFDYYNA